MSHWLHSWRFLYNVVLAIALSANLSGSFHNGCNGPGQLGEAWDVFGTNARIFETLGGWYFDVFGIRDRAPPPFDGCFLPGCLQDSHGNELCKHVGYGIS